MNLVTINCQMPPSVNRLWRSRMGANGKPSYYLDRRYQVWKRVFDNIVLATRPRPRIEGPFVAVVTLDGTKRRKGSDVDNRVKAALDACERAGVIDNDSLAESVTARWGFAPEGCRIVLSEAIV